MTIVDAIVLLAAGFVAGRGLDALSGPLNFVLQDYLFSWGRKRDQKRRRKRGPSVDEIEELEDELRKAKS